MSTPWENNRNFGLRHKVLKELAKYGSLRVRLNFIGINYFQSFNMGKIFFIVGNQG
jgi:hypothetical protein